jgi:hypothetical protein
VESDPREATAARQRQAAMVEELRKAELVHHRLQGLNQLVGTYPEGHDTRVLLENLKTPRPSPWSAPGIALGILSGRSAVLRSRTCVRHRTGAWRTSERLHVRVL